MFAVMYIHGMHLKSIQCEFAVVHFSSDHSDRACQMFRHFQTTTILCRDFDSETVVRAFDLVQATSTHWM